MQTLTIELLTTTIVVRYKDEILQLEEITTNLVTHSQT